MYAVRTAVLLGEGQERPPLRLSGKSFGRECDLARACRSVYAGSVNLVASHLERPWIGAIESSDDTISAPVHFDAGEFRSDLSMPAVSHGLTR